jgi:tyrosyl-tRNA synthetase
MTKGDGMSYSEFTYPLMQAWDWWHMHHTKGISMQIGGSDQYGNITAGIDAIKYIRAHHPNEGFRNVAKGNPEPLGLTVPLLTTSSGEKFGKSAGNAIWLGLEQTSSFELYGYFLRTADADVEKFLKMFTFLPLKDIEILIKEHEKMPSQRKAQHKLALEFVELVHGRQESTDAALQHGLLFQKASGSATPSTESAYRNDGNAMPEPVNAKIALTVNITLPRSLINHGSIGKILYAAGIADSASEGHRLIKKAGAYIGGLPHGNNKVMNDNFLQWATIKSWRPEENKLYLIHDDLLMLRRGKHNIKVVQVVSDEVYAASGASYPGMMEESGDRVTLPDRDERKPKRQDDTEMGKVFRKPLEDSAARLLAEDEEDNPGQHRSQ